MSTQEERRQIWESRIAAFRASGQKATEWCAANQINRRQLLVGCGGLTTLEPQ